MTTKELPQEPIENFFRMMHGHSYDAVSDPQKYLKELFEKQKMTTEQQQLPPAFAYKPG